jgi:hypothetical protein
LANIDVSELLSDPDFVDAVALVSRSAVVNGFGENKIEETCKNTVGSVQPASGKVIQRLPEALRVANVQSFWIKGPIKSNDPYPDIISFKGKRYQVQMVFDWTNWGEGWSEGTCVAEKPS